MKAKCFECGEELIGVGKSMEDLIEIRFPVFCCQVCADSFPDNGTNEFENKLKELTPNTESGKR